MRTLLIRLGSYRKAVGVWLVIASAMTGFWAPAHAESVPQPVVEDPIVIRSFDGTPIVARLMLPGGASAQSKVPAIMMTHGWGGKRPTGENEGNLDDVIVRKLRDAGYAVLTWDSRGFGQSGGEASLGGPAEVGDAQALIDYLSNRPEIVQDGVRDPRVGWTGASNAGGVQFNTAAVDRRVDAIAPIAAWGDLNQDLWPNGTNKVAWADSVAAGGLATSASDGIFSPAGTQLGTIDPHIISAVAEANLTGQPRTENRSWFEARSTTTRSGSITAPTLIIQGTIDTFFPLENGFTNFQNLVAAGTPTKLVAACLGHTLVGCTYGPNRSDRDALSGKIVWQQRLLEWMDRYVKRAASVKTGPKVEWQANDGRYYGASGLPLSGTNTVTGLPMTTGVLTGPGATGGDGPTNGAPALDAELGLTAARSTVLAPSSSVRDIVGVPSVRLNGSVIGLSAQVHLELVDLAPDGTRVTVNDQTMPWRFAGTINQDVDLHGVAWRLEPGHALQLEITTGSAQYNAPSTGAFTVDLQAVAKIPVTTMN